MAASHWTVQKSILVNQSTLGKGGQRWSNNYFTLFLAGGFSAETLNGLERKGLSSGNSSPTRLFLEISRNNKLKGK